MSLTSAIAAVASPRAARKARRARRAAAHAQEAAAKRAAEQYAEETGVQRQELSQSFSSRGLTPDSSIYQQTMARYERARARGEATAQDYANVARLQRRATAAQLTMENTLAPFEMLESLGRIGGGIAVGGLAGAALVSVGMDPMSYKRASEKE